MPLFKGVAEGLYIRSKVLANKLFGSLIVVRSIVSMGASVQVRNRFLNVDSSTDKKKIFGQRLISPNEIHNDVVFGINEHVLLEFRRAPRIGLFGRYDPL